ncbi:MAG: hypothetical protein ACMUHX_11305, partial [bacterium]
LAGWSMICLPAISENAYVLSLFPDAKVIYGYEKGKGYVRVKDGENMEVRKGYWILLNEAKTYTLTGRPINNYTLSINEDGWHMIGGCTLSAKALSDNCTIKVIYGYEQGSGYTRVPDSEYLQPGKGYWILFEGVTDQASLNVQVTLE